MRSRVIVFGCALLAAACSKPSPVAPGPDGGPRPTDASAPLDAAPPQDASPNLDAGPVDLGVIPDSGPPPSGDLSLGPFPSAVAILDDSIDHLAASLDTRTTYRHAPAQGQLLHVVAERLSIPAGLDAQRRDALIDLALAEFRELEDASSQVVGGGPGFGLDRAWDAFGDGTENPAFTNYAWQSSMVALGIAQLAAYLQAHPELDRGAELADLLSMVRAMLVIWNDHFTYLPDGGAPIGFYWYSLEPADEIAVHNTSALLSIASQLYAEVSGEVAFSERPEAFARMLAARRFLGPDGGLAWHYADDGYPAAPVVEDIEHSELTLYFVRFAYEHGWWSEDDVRQVATTLTDTVWTGNPVRANGRLDGSSTGDLEFRSTRWLPITMPLFSIAPSDRPELYDIARSILVSSYLSRFSIHAPGATVDVERTLALARLVKLRPAAFAEGSRWALLSTELQSGPLAWSPDGWGLAEPIADSSGWTLGGRASMGGRIILDPTGAVEPRAALSITYQSEQDAVIQVMPAGASLQLSASKDDNLETRWMRTTRVVGSADREFVLPPGVQVHLVEVTPIP